MSFRIGRRRFVSAPERSCNQVLSTIVVGALLLGVPIYYGYIEYQGASLSEAISEGSRHLVRLPPITPASSTDVGGHPAVPAGSLVYLTSQVVDTQPILQDADFDIQFPASLRLRRQTEYCQWQESWVDREERNSEGETYTTREYYYTLGWVDHRINSMFFNQPFAHQNPNFDPYPSFEDTVASAALGPYTLSGELAQMARPLRPIIEYEREEIARFRTSPAVQQNGFSYANDGYFYHSYERSTSERLFRAMGTFLEGSLLDFQIGDLFSRCNAGDIRIRYEVMPVNQGVSVIGRLANSNGRIDIYRTSRGYPLGMVHEGFDVTPEAIFDREMSDQRWTIIFARLALVPWVLIAGHIADYPFASIQMRLLGSASVVSVVITSISWLTWGSWLRLVLVLASAGALGWSYQTNERLLGDRPRARPSQRRRSPSPAGKPARD
ncbi:uncharacterized protein BJ171DRAFT_11017 [Polychytrium aggregatum]|uniref:uncharacterized protein n=1 Tax=Polychytrium aggregatum TaxID=110093 RepID=UPI0022FF43D8|nr:uncharacterized protein BJ171DRAFT_11017 [Polychytrium aggregatum]KAI9209934.1 hypothetical protein BJ171DRAFT_11017 [Polychytrium aggregatum]